jgi:ubiquinone/menaquinone biosynthesis C-methylase UbiE
MGVTSRSEMAVVRVSLDVPLDAPRAFESFFDELVIALAGAGIAVDPREDGQLVDGQGGTGRVVTWRPGERAVLQWRQAEWAPGQVADVEVRAEPVEGGSRLILEHRGWAGAVSDPADCLGWFAAGIAAPLVRATSPAALGDWITDRRARRPSGPAARETYRDPLYHHPNFRVILSELAVVPDDYLVEVGCGGGALLKEALRSGCRAAAVDHSPDMVRLATEVNRNAVAEGRLQVRRASAEQLPFADATFTCAAMTGVLGFLADPVAAFREIRRVLRAGGRLVCLGSDPELRGTPGAPEPIASRLKFYESADLVELATEAGFDGVRVIQRSLEQFAREVGVPEEHLALFGGTGARFLLARKT